MTDGEVIAEVERWFVARGLPYFVDRLRREAQLGLSRPRFLPVVLLTLVVAAAAAVLVGWLGDDVSGGVLTGFLVAGLLLAGYGAARLHIAPMARWAVGHTLTSLGLLFPLVTRALPLLLLFVTFLFINTEVWQVASNLDGAVLWVAVLLFGAVAVGFLLVRLPEELDRVDDQIAGERLVADCQGTPVAGIVSRLVDADLGEDVQVHGFEKGNLILVLLVSQAVQVLLLAGAVFAFFVVFGAVAIREPVLAAWLIEEPRWLLDGWHVLSIELFQVATFLAAFSGLYFTVYAVSDDNYRKQFFDSLMTELEQALAVRAVYRTLS